LDALFDDVLIGVTEFFRDPEAWEELRTIVVPRLIEQRSQRQPIRVWVPGCATGEEPYSIGMLLLEALDGTRSVPVQIFATDIDRTAVPVARAGPSPRRHLSHAPPTRVRRFFTNERDDCVRVRSDLRACMIFARQNIISDPPYSHLDLISC